MTMLAQPSLRSDVLETSALSLCIIIINLIIFRMPILFILEDWMTFGFCLMLQQYTVYQQLHSSLKEKHVILLFILYLAHNKIYQFNHHVEAYSKYCMRT